MHTEITDAVSATKWKKRNQDAMATQEAYFVPRSEILAWINSTLGMRISKVEEVSMCWQRPSVAACCCLLPASTTLLCCS